MQKSLTHYTQTCTRRKKIHVKETNPGCDEPGIQTQQLFFPGKNGYLFQLHSTKHTQFPITLDRNCRKLSTITVDIEIKALVDKNTTDMHVIDCTIAVDTEIKVLMDKNTTERHVIDCTIATDTEIKALVYKNTIKRHVIDCTIAVATEIKALVYKNTTERHFMDCTIATDTEIKAFWTKKPQKGMSLIAL